MAKRNKKHNKGFERYFQTNSNYAKDAMILKAVRQKKKELLESGQIIKPHPQAEAMQKFIKDNGIKGVSVESLGNLNFLSVDDSVLDIGNLKSFLFDDSTL